MDKLPRPNSNFPRLPIDAGGDSVQIFDSLGGVLSDGNFLAGSVKWIKDIISGLEGRVPVIVFSKGTHGNWRELVETGAQVLGADWNVRLGDVAAGLPGPVGGQGELDPFLLCSSPGILAAETQPNFCGMDRRSLHTFT